MGTHPKGRMRDLRIPAWGIGSAGHRRRPAAAAGPGDVSNQVKPDYKTFRTWRLCSKVARSGPMERHRQLRKKDDYSSSKKKPLT